MKTIDHPRVERDGDGNRTHAAKKIGMSTADVSTRKLCTSINTGRILNHERLLEHIQTLRIHTLEVGKYSRWLQLRTARWRFGVVFSGLLVGEVLPVWT